MGSAAVDSEGLRSHRWFAESGLRTFGHRSRLKQMGYNNEEFEGRPIIAILNTWNELSPCHLHFKQRVDAVRRGVYEGGGFPVEIPVMSLSEMFQKPTTMLYRNLLAMEVEEILRSYPIDGAVLMGGCDKTTPGLVMGAVSMDLPAIFLPAGPMLHGCWRGQRLGSGTDTWLYWDKLRAGEITEQDWEEIEDGIARTPGTCMTMGTASTMTAAVEAMGLSLPGSSSIPAAVSEHMRMSAVTGRRIVSMVWEGMRPSQVLSRGSLLNAIKVVLAIGGSTNAIIHLTAIAGRLGLPLELSDFDRLAHDVPVLANIRPSGAYLMEDFYDAGGLPGIMRVLGERLDLRCPTVAGDSIAGLLADVKPPKSPVIKTLDAPVRAEGGLAVLYGNIAPDGCVIKTSAASAGLLQHTGPAFVLDGYDDVEQELDEAGPNLEKDTVLVLRQCGPVGGPGMPEWGMIPIPKALLQRGVTDMVRISDARMSGTSYGTCVLHVAPESAVGGPLCLVRTGDPVRLDVPARRLDVLVDDAEWDRRRSEWTPPPAHYDRGYGMLAAQHMGQANTGCDFDFLVGSGAPEPTIH